MRIKTIILTLILSFSYLPAFANDNLNKLPCEESAADIKIALDNINFIDGLIESVPPNSKEYFAKEYKAALNDPNGGRRFNLVTSQPYFHAWKLHESFSNARKQIEIVQRLAGRTEKLKTRIIYTISALYKLSNAQLAFQKYLTAENLHTHKIADRETVLSGADGMISMYLNCLVENLDEK